MRKIEAVAGFLVFVCSACSSPNDGPAVASGTGGRASGGSPSGAGGSSSTAAGGALMATGGKGVNPDSAAGGSVNSGTGGGGVAGPAGGSGGSMVGSGGARTTGGAAATGGAATTGSGGQSAIGDVGAALNGQRWETPASPMMAPGKDYCVYKDTTLAFGGTPGTIYTVTLHFRGVLEGKGYVGGTAEGHGLQFYRGGMPGTTDPWVRYNSVGFSVSEPAQTYYVNHAETDVIFDDTVYALDSTATVQIAGGAMLRLFSEDSNCEAVPNSLPIVIPGITNSGQLQFAQVDVVSVVAN